MSESVKHLTGPVGVADSEANLLNQEVFDELCSLWDQKAAARMQANWRMTQLRPPVSVEEVDDAYFGIGGD
jgi:hypothetical protein